MEVNVSLKLLITHSMIILVYWLAPLTIGISNMIISELMHLASFQGTHGRTAGLRGWKPMHPLFPLRKGSILETIFGTLLTFENLE